VIDLPQYREPLLEFLENGAMEFRRLNPDIVIRHAALYCCPWAGWIALSLARTVQPGQNCPDFEYHEVAVFQADSWRAAYEASSKVTIRTADEKTVLVDTNVDGDEGLNVVFFEFLQSLLQDPRARSALGTLARRSLHVGVQLLDSQYNKAWAFVA
jgi:hypothetical protein